MAAMAETRWDVLSSVAEMTWDFCPGWRIVVGIFVQGDKKSHWMFCPGMFCPSLIILLCS